MKKGLLTMAGVLLTVSLVSAGTTVPVLAEEETTLVYGSGDYTRINPAMDEHGEINILIFNGLTAHDGENQVVPGLAESWDFDDETNTYTFHMAEDAKWQDGEPVTAEDVKFTIEAIMNPENGSENAPNYEDVEEINVIDDHTVAFKLEDKNVAFLDYMTMAVLPKHLLEGEDMQTSDFFRNPVGTGPYKIESWDEGQAITLVKNEDYFKGEPSIDKIVFKIVPDDNAKALQLKSGELDLALLTPKDAAAFADDEAYTCYDMKTSDYRGIMFNFGNEYWQKNRDLIPAEAVVAVTFFDSVVCSGLSSFFVSSDGVTVAALPEDELSEDELPEVFVSSFPSEDDASLCRYSTSTAPHPPSSCSTHTRSFTLFVLSSVKVTFGVCQSPHAVIAVASPVNNTLSSSAFNICMVTSDCAPWAYASNV